MLNMNKEKLIIKVLNLSRLKKTLLGVFLDITFCVLSNLLVLSIILDQKEIHDWLFILPIIISICISIPIFLYAGIYKIIYRYVNDDSLKVLIKSIIIYTFIFFLIFSVFGIQDIPKSIGLMQPTMFFILICTSRWLVTLSLSNYLSFKTKEIDKKEVIIYGAGETGRQLASNLVHSSEFKLIFFVDDNKNFWEGTINGYPVKSPTFLNKFSSKGKPKELWLAMTNITSTQRHQLTQGLNKLRLHVRTLPSFSDLTNQKVSLTDIRELDINELIGRNPVKANNNLLRKCILKKTVLVTGAGGSIGSEICRQVLLEKPKCIVLLEISEIALYNINYELVSYVKKQPNDMYNEIILVPLLVDINDKKKLDYVFKTWKPNTVYHTAAYKHVPIVEHNVVSGIQNNVLGTLNCAKIAAKNNVENFVLISTDKAVRPTNIMGASKRLAEISLQLLNIDLDNKHTRFCIVRFGNVLGSSGSVVPIFRKQIKTGGPITLTDKRVTRYFMTIVEAAQLVIQAGSMSKGGEVFVLDMGKPLLILDVAVKMIETAGLQLKNEKTPWGDIEIKVTGLRPGEKLYEELLIGNNPKPTRHSRILQANEDFISKKDFNKLIDDLIIYLDNNNIKKIKELLKNNVSGYVPGKDVDWTSISKNL